MLVVVWCNSIAWWMTIFIINQSNKQSTNHWMVMVKVIEAKDNHIIISSFSISSLVLSFIFIHDNNTKTTEPKLYLFYILNLENKTTEISIKQTIFSVLYQLLLISFIRPLSLSWPLLLSIVSYFIFTYWLTLKSSNN